MIKRRLRTATLTVVLPFAMLLVTAANSSAIVLPPGSIPFPTPVGTPIQFRPQQLITNGGFEQSGGWTSWEGAIRSQTVRHCGQWSMSLGSFGQTFIYQTVFIPASANPTLSFWLRVDTTVTAPTADDTLRVTVHAPGSSLFPGTELGTVATFSNLDASNGAFVRRGTYSLSSYVGQTVQIVFSVSPPGPGSGSTIFYVDDVSLLTAPRLDIPCL